MKAMWLLMAAGFLAALVPPFFGAPAFGGHSLLALVLVTIAVIVGDRKGLM